MTKKAYMVEFTITKSVWADDPDAAYDKARRLVIENRDNLADMLWSYDECVSEAYEFTIGSDDPDDPGFGEAR